MKNRKIITTLLILMLAIISISVVSAAEINSPMHRAAVEPAVHDLFFINYKSSFLYNIAVRLDQR